ncbi:MAG: hypothetical protein KC431_13390, partial [Myxococcales bacterium]|nr:hypothetical protein [Myxococcales bacterium]
MVGAGLVGLVLVCAACTGAPDDKTILIHPDDSAAAKALWNVDFEVEFTVPENFRYRTEEYGSAVADPARGLVYVGSRDGMLLAV